MEIDKIREGSKLLGRITQLNNILWALKEQVPETIKLTGAPATEGNNFTSAGFNIVVPEEIKEIVVDTIRAVYKEELKKRIEQLEAL